MRDTREHCPERNGREFSPAHVGQRAAGERCRERHERKQGAQGRGNAQTHAERTRCPVPIYWCSCRAPLWHGPLYKVGEHAADAVVARALGQFHQGQRVRCHGYPAWDASEGSELGCRG